MEQETLSYSVIYTNKLVITVCLATRLVAVGKSYKLYIYFNISSAKTKNLDSCDHIEIKT